MNSSAGRPIDLSVVMLIGDQRRRAEAALASVLRQVRGLSCEVLVVDTGQADRPQVTGLRHPLVRVLHFPDAEHFGALRASAVRASKGEIVAFLEDHVTIDPGFLPAVLEALRGDWVAVGPVVRNANPDRGLSNAVHFLHYGLWDPSQKTASPDLIPGNNSAYRKRVLETYAGRLDRLLLADTVLQMRLKADLHGYVVADGARLKHLNATSLKAAMLSEYLYQRCFAAERADEFGWSGRRRVRSLIGLPVSPWVRILRLARRVLSWSPRPMRRFLMSVPALLVLEHTAALGRLVGLVWGPGDTPAKFTRFEMNYRRPV